MLICGFCIKKIKGSVGDKFSNDGTRTRDELITMVPARIDRDHWASFVDYRLNSKTKVY